MSVTYIQLFKFWIDFYKTRYKNFTFLSISEEFHKCEGNFTSIDTLGVIFFVIIITKCRALTKTHIFMVCIVNNLLKN